MTSLVVTVSVTVSSLSRARRIFGLEDTVVVKTWTLVVAVLVIGAGVTVEVFVIVAGLGVLVAAIVLVFRTLAVTVRGT